MTSTHETLPDAVGGSGWHSCGASYVAVYGTLRAGGVNDIARLRPSAACIGRTLLRGSLYDLGWYPGLSLEGQQEVLAEVYPLDPALEQVLDGYEGIWPQDTGEYAKRILTLPVALLNGETQMKAVMLYEAMPGAIEGTPVIDSSDWLVWFRENKQPRRG